MSGAQLPDEMIEQFKTLAGTNQKVQFQAFTSTSRNQEAAEMFGNVLFQIDTTDYGVVDISVHSNYPDEEEILLSAAYTCTVSSCKYDKTKKKWFIQLFSDYAFHDWN